MRAPPPRMGTTSDEVRRGAVERRPAGVARAAAVAAEAASAWLTSGSEFERFLKPCRGGPSEVGDASCDEVLSGTTPPSVMRPTSAFTST